MKQKIYAPVGDFERATSYCPLYLAWRILDEARDYFRTPIPEAFADKLAHRAEAVFAHHPSWQRRFKSTRGREFILTSMRHGWPGFGPGTSRPVPRPAGKLQSRPPVAGDARSVAAVCNRRIASENLRTRRSQTPLQPFCGNPVQSAGLSTAASCFRLRPRLQTGKQRPQRFPGMHQTGLPCPALQGSDWRSIR